MKEQIVVGQGCTQLIGSDRHPYSVIQVISNRKLVVQADTARATKNSNYYGRQNYVYSRNPNGDKLTITLRKNGRWCVRGEEMHGTGISPDPTEIIRAAARHLTHEN